MTTKAIAAIDELFNLLACDSRRDRVGLVMKSIRKLKQGRYTAAVTGSIIMSYMNTIPDDDQRMRQDATSSLGEDAPNGVCMLSVVRSHGERMQGVRTHARVSRLRRRGGIDLSTLLPVTPLA